MQLIFEKSVKGRATAQYPDLDVPEESLEGLTGGVMRSAPAELPELAEVQVIRHFQELAATSASTTPSTRSGPAR